MLTEAAIRCQSPQPSGTTNRIMAERPFTGSGKGETQAGAGTSAFFLVWTAPEPNGFQPGPLAPLLARLGLSVQSPIAALDSPAALRGCSCGRRSGAAGMILQIGGNPADRNESCWVLLSAALEKTIQIMLADLVIIATVLEEKTRQS